MTLKELKEKLDKLSKAYKDNIEIMVDSGNDTYRTPNAVDVRTDLSENGEPVERIYSVRK